MLRYLYIMSIITIIQQPYTREILMRQSFKFVMNHNFGQMTNLSENTKGNTKGLNLLHRVPEAFYHLGRATRKLGSDSLPTRTMHTMLFRNDVTLERSEGSTNY